ncbi:hypothetical protein Tco_0261191 [Tanacetum coccineum]
MVERASSPPASVPAATTHTTDDLDSAAGGTSNPAGSAFGAPVSDSTVPTPTAMDSAGSRRESRVFTLQILLIVLPRQMSLLITYHLMFCLIPIRDQGYFYPGQSTAGKYVTSPAHSSTLHTVGLLLLLGVLFDGNSAVSFDAAVLDGASTVSAACIVAAGYLVSAVVPAGSSSSVPADYVSAGHVLVFADRDRIC